MKISPINPTKKLYGIIEDEIKGNLTIYITDSMFYYKIDYGKKVNKFGGKRKLIISKLTAFGGTHYFLGAAYMAIGGILSLFSLTFFCCHRKQRSLMGQTEPLNE